MSNLRNEYLICYDIEDNKTRKKHYAFFLDLGLSNIQKSVFWGYLSQAELSSIKHLANSTVKKTDKLLILPVSTRNKNNILMGHSHKDFIDWEDYGVI